MNAATIALMVLAVGCQSRRDDAASDPRPSGAVPWANVPALNGAGATIFQIDERRLLILGRKVQADGTRAGCEPGIILASSDGGKVWSVAWESPFDGELLGATRLRNGRVLIFGHETCEGGHSPFLLAPVSALAWERHDVPFKLRAERHYQGFGYVDARDLPLLRLGVQFYDEPHPMDFVETTDFGRTWTEKGMKNLPANQWLGATALSATTTDLTLEHVDHFIQILKRDGRQPLAKIPTVTPE